MVPCSACSGSGLMLRSPISDAERGDTVQSADANEVSGGAENGGRVLPSDGMVIESVDVAIIGGGIGGLALALALQQRGVRCAVYERDNSIGERSQGYGLTMQQGGTALRAIGLTQAVTTAGLHSTAHYSFDALSGALIGSHGAATRAAAPDAASNGAATRVDSALASGKQPIEAPGTIDGTAAAAESACSAVASASGAPAAGSMAAQCKRAGSTAAHKQNVHLPRQSLRALLYAGLAPGTVRWGFRFRGARVRRDESSGEAPMDVTAPDDEKVTAPDDENVTAPDDEKVTAPDDENVTAPDDEKVTAPDDEKEMCGEMGAGEVGAGEAAVGVAAAGVAVASRPCRIVEVTVEQHRDRAQRGGHGDGAEEAAPLPPTCRTVLAKALVGADGIRSAVRAALVQESGEVDSAPLRALQVIVILDYLLSTSRLPIECLPHQRATPRIAGDRLLDYLLSTS